MADIEKLKALAVAVGGKSWAWWTSCSFRRLTVEGERDGEALSAAVCADGVATIDGPEAVCEFIEAASPAAVLELIAEVEHARLVRFLHGEKATPHWRRLEADRNGLVADLERVRDQLKAAGAEGVAESDMRQGLCAALALAEQALPVLPAPQLTSRLREKLQAMQEQQKPAGDAGGADRG